MEVENKVIRPNIPERKNLIDIYDFINKIATNLEKKGINKSELFYSEKDLTLLKTNKDYIFI